MILIGEFGTIRWSAVSPHLTWLVTLLWGYPKNKLAMELDSAKKILKIILQNVEVMNNNFVQEATERMKHLYRECVVHNGGLLRLGIICVM